jgi:hypothetical protein
MLKVNRELLDLSVIYSSLNHPQTWALAHELNIAKKNLKQFIIDIDDNEEFTGQYKTERATIVEQGEYINKNLKTLEDALMCHETNIFDKRVRLGDLQVFGLN